MPSRMKIAKKGGRRRVVGLLLIRISVAMFGFQGVSGLHEVRILLTEYFHRYSDNPLHTDGNGIY